MSHRRRSPRDAAVVSESAVVMFREAPMHSVDYGCFNLRAPLAFDARSAFIGGSELRSNGALGEVKQL